MATTITTESQEEVILSGFLTKQGGQYRSWKKRHFELKGTKLIYYKSEGDLVPRGEIDLTEGRGMRSKKCTTGLEWPNDAKPNVTFGIAIEGRTYYMYGTNPAEVKKWKKALQTIIDKHGKPTTDWEQDSEGKPEHVVSKVLRGAAKFGAKVTRKVVRDTGLVEDERIAGIIEGVVDGVEKQAEASRDTSITDRVKWAAGDTAGIVGENVDYQPVNVVCDVITEQVEADDDVNLVQRAGLFVGTTLQGTSEFVPDEIGQGVVLTAGHIIHDQSDADLDSTITERLVLGLGSTANGIGESLNDEIGQTVTQGVGIVTEKVHEVLKEEREKEELERELQEEEEEDDDDDDSSSSED